MNESHEPSQSAEDKASYEQFFQSVSGIAHQISDLQLQLAESQRPFVDQMIRQKSRDHASIERVLDQLLDSAAHPVGLKLFRRLCRYYWTINPQATAEYILAYREMWDDDDVESGEEGAR